MKSYVDRNPNGFIKGKKSNYFWIRSMLGLWTRNDQIRLFTGTILGFIVVSDVKL